MQVEAIQTDIPKAMVKEIAEIIKEEADKDTKYAVLIGEKAAIRVLVNDYSEEIESLKEIEEGKIIKIKKGCVHRLLEHCRITGPQNISFLIVYGFGETEYKHYRDKVEELKKSWRR